MSHSDWFGMPLSKCRRAGLCHFQDGVAAHAQHAGEGGGRVTFKLEWQVAFNVHWRWVASFPAWSGRALSKCRGGGSWHWQLGVTSHFQSERDYGLSQCQR